MILFVCLNIFIKGINVKYIKIYKKNEILRAKAPRMTINNNLFIQ